MDMLRKIWPTPFKIEKGNVVSFLIQLIIFLVITAVVGWLIAILVVSVNRLPMWYSAATD